MEQKPWYRSLTLWSAVITAAGVFAPKYSTVIPATAGDVSAIAGLIGVIIGRLRAKKPIDLGG